MGNTKDHNVPSNRKGRKASFLSSDNSLVNPGNCHVVVSEDSKCKHVLVDN